MDVAYHRDRYETMVDRRRATLELIQSDSFDDKWVIKRPTQHQWSIDELLRHMLANEVRYLQIPLHPDISQHPFAVRAQWVGNILFRLEEREHREIDEIVDAFEETEAKSREILGRVTTDDLDQKVKAPWGDMLPYRSMLSDLFDHDQFHRGQIHYLITYFRGPPDFKEVPEGVDFG